MRAAISCQILEGDQPVSFRWERDGRPLRAQALDGAATRRHDEFSAALVIERVAAKHAANYTCIASNVAGPDRFTVPLIVNGRPGRRFFFPIYFFKNFSNTFISSAITGV